MAEAAPVSPTVRTARSPAKPEAGRLSRVKDMFSGAGVLVLTVGACWALFFSKLWGEWEINAQYNYGFVVPLLGLALVWLRWPDRPPAGPQIGGGPAALVWAGLLFLVFPFLMLFEANPEWRLLYWVNGFQAIGLSLCLLYRLGGWSWVKFFAPALVFMLIAVPWPMEMETQFVQGLMRQVAGWTVEVAGWLGIPAVQHGNAIEVSVGTIGIDEACSGVRSLQSALMLSLFLGELFRFAWPRRLGLLAGSLLFVLLANLGRTTFLVWAAANRGMRQMQGWHDLAGLLVMLIVLPSLMGLAWLMKPKASEAASPPPAGPAPLPALSRWPGIVSLVWIGVSIAATEAWYRSHESNLIPNARWSVAWPADNPQFKKAALPENSLAILRCSDSEAASWRDADGTQWSAFLLRWNPGKNSSQLAKGHRPEICFPAAGAKLIEDFGQTNLRGDGVELPFRHESFASGDRLLHVFYCLWSDRRAPDQSASTPEDGSRNSRLQAVLAGKRNLGQQVLEIVLEGPATGDEALSELKLRLPDLVRRQ